VELENQLRTYRRLNNWSTSDFAKLVGVSESTIFLMEKNRVIPKITTVYKIAEVLDIPLEEVFYKKGNKPRVKIPEALL
jgi:putative transcriptional regulator